MCELRQAIENGLSISEVENIQNTSLDGREMYDRRIRLEKCMNVGIARY
jgi:hypothetical protein